MNDYQRRENLRFYGIEEKEATSEDSTETILKNFLHDELDVSDVWSMKFQRVHRLENKCPENRDQ